MPGGLAPVRTFQRDDYLLYGRVAELGEAHPAWVRAPKSGKLLCQGINSEMLTGLMIQGCNCVQSKMMKLSKNPYFA